MNTFHAYICTSGCGHTTIVNKKYRNKRIHCAVCAEKTTMEYIGECEINLLKQPNVFNPIH